MKRAYRNLYRRRLVKHKGKFIYNGELRLGRWWRVPEGTLIRSDKRMLFNLVIRRFILLRVRHGEKVKDIAKKYQMLPQHASKLLSIAIKNEQKDKKMIMKIYKNWK